MKENLTLINNMRKKSFTISEKEIANEFRILNQTHSYLHSEKNKIEAKLNYYIKKLESEFSEEIEAKANEAFREHQNIIKKMNWEMRQCQVFDKKVEVFNKNKHLQVVSGLARKILNRDK